MAAAARHQVITVPLNSMHTQPKWQRQSRPGPVIDTHRVRSPAGLAVLGCIATTAGFVLGVAALSVAGFICIGAAILTAALRPRATVMHWRGREIKLNPPPSWRSRLYDFLYGPDPE